MAVYEITEDGLREAIDEIHVPCNYTGCAEKATTILRCRTYRSVSTLICERHLEEGRALIARHVAEHGHTHCPGCDEPATSLEQIMDLLPLSGVER